MPPLPDVIRTSAPAHTDEPSSVLQVCAAALTNGAANATDSDHAALLLWKHLKGDRAIGPGKYVAVRDIPCHRGYSKNPESVWREGKVGVISRIVTDASGEEWARVHVDSESIIGLWGNVLTSTSFCSIRPCQVQWNPDVTVEIIDDGEDERHQKFLDITKDIYRTETNYQSKAGTLSQTGQKHFANNLGGQPSDILKGHSQTS